MNNKLIRYYVPFVAGEYPDHQFMAGFVDREDEIKSQVDVGDIIQELVIKAGFDEDTGIVPLNFIKIGYVEKEEK